jgi:outer membrane biosynthesis protein TonB
MRQDIWAKGFGALLLFSIAASVPWLPSSNAQSNNAARWGAQLNVKVLAPSGSAGLQKYTDQLAARVKQNWYAAMPEQAFLGASGTVSVVFHILPDGTIPNDEPKIESSTKREELDKAAFKALHDSAPFTALPARFRGSGVKLRCDFVYNMRPESLRKHQYDANPDGTPRPMLLDQPDN